MRSRRDNSNVSSRRAAAQRASEYARRRQKARERAEENARHTALYAERFLKAAAGPDDVSASATALTAVAVATPKPKRNWLPLAAAAAIAATMIMALDSRLWPRWAAIALAPQAPSQTMSPHSVAALGDVPAGEPRTDIRPLAPEANGFSRLKETMASRQVPGDRATQSSRRDPIASAASPVAAGALQATDVIAALEFEPSHPRRSGPDGICELPPDGAVGPDLRGLDGADFGQALAQAAESQTADFVVYTDKYKRLAYPMGDVPKLFGVCTDVVIRAYRALGIDLQALVHEAKLGSADTNIAHRRTFTLRRFFASRGASRRISEFPEDYLPGDIVTYDRPQNRRSRDHIAIVTGISAPSGRPMIVHNRGWGPQIEDALFVDKITGHYRYSGSPTQRSAEVAATLRAARAKALTQSRSKPELLMKQ